VRRLSPSIEARLGSNSLTTEPDKQQIELIGTAALSVALIRRGFEIARPLRDHGIDLVIFFDAPGRVFSALPMQVKVHGAAALMIEHKYEGFDGLVYAIVWDALSKPRFFFFDHNEAVTLIPEVVLSKDTWTGPDGHQTWTKAPRWLKEKLEPFEARWDWLHSRLVAMRPAPFSN
jgi:hypothetical protein